MAGPRTLLEKVWDDHVVRHALDEPDLLFIDLHLVHEVTSPQAFEALRLAGRSVRRADLTLATIDHGVPTIASSLGITDPLSKKQIDTLIRNCERNGITLYGLGDVRRGIVHIIGPEQGATQPGMTIVCGDSHTSTHGAFGALAFGIGTSEVEHVLATQTLSQKKPRSMAVTIDGELTAGVTAKDVILAIIGRIGVHGGVGHVIEYRGPVIEALSMEGRMTVCNMSIEAGARAGMIGPDDTTFAYLEGRNQAPQGTEWARALDYWSTLPTDPGATFHEELVVDGSELAPYVTWGTNPGHTVPVTDVVPSPDDFDDPDERGKRPPGLAVHGPSARHSDHRDPHRSCVLRLLYQRPHRGSPRGSRRPGGQEGAPRRRCDGRARVGPGETAGRGGGTRPHFCRRRIRMARRRLLDVPGHEPGHPPTG